MAGGEEADWGRVLVWEPPLRVVFSWHPNPEAPASTEVEARFSGETEGTRVEVEHRGWAALGDIAAERRAEYASASGWPMVIGLFEAGAA